MVVFVHPVQYQWRSYSGRSASNGRGTSIAPPISMPDRYIPGTSETIPGESESGDQWAWIGRDTSHDHKVNPMDFEFGSHAFGTDTGGDAGRVVTDHSPRMCLITVNKPDTWTKEQNP